MKLIKLFAPLLLIALFLPDTRSHASSLTGGESKTDFGAYAAWGLGLPGSPSAGLAYSVFKLGVAADTGGHSLAYSASVTGRSRKYFMSPIIGINLNYLSVRPGDISHSAYVGGRHEFLLTISVGAGVEVAPDTLIDGGIVMIRGYNPYPFVSVTWPLSID